MTEMDRETFRTEMDARGITLQVRAAKALRVNQATVSRWLSGETPIPSWVEIAILGIPKRRARKHRQARARGGK